MRRYEAVKRSMDVAAAVVGLALTAPVQLVVAAVVRTNLGNPVLFRQHRPGLNGKIFILVKFRTMRAIDEESGLVSDRDRLGRVGRALRSTSLDELPTLWNVLVGDMSIVGPRPLLPEYLERYSLKEARRHEVRPGITGLAQVNGRNAQSWEERLSDDVRYVDQRNLLLDFCIVLRTVGIVFSARGIAAHGHSTMHRFQGQRDICFTAESEKED